MVPSDTQGGGTAPDITPPEGGIHLLNTDLLMVLEDTIEVLTLECLLGS